MSRDGEVCFYCLTALEDKKGGKNMKKVFEVTVLRRYRIEGDEKTTEKDAKTIACENFNAEKEQMDAEDMCQVTAFELFNGEPVPERTAVSALPKLVLEKPK